MKIDAERDKQEQITTDGKEERILALQGFYRHLLVYVLVNALLVGINLVNTPEQLWFQWPLLGWGIGLVVEALRTFTDGRVWGLAWVDQKIRSFFEGSNSSEGK